jgi:hypothetical protein
VEIGLFDRPKCLDVHQRSPVLGSTLTVVANSQEALSGPNSSCGGLRIFGIVASKCEFTTRVNLGVKPTGDFIFDWMPLGDVDIKI